MLSCSRVVSLVVSVCVGFSVFDVFADGPVSGAQSSVSYRGDVLPILMEHCAICHMKNERYGYLTIDEDNAYTAMVEVPAFSMPNMNRIEPGEPEKSYVWLKLTGGYLKLGGKGWPMPPMGILSQDKRDAIRNWIEQGARNN